MKARTSVAKILKNQLILKIKFLQCRIGFPPLFSFFRLRTFKDMTGSSSSALFCLIILLISVNAREPTEFIQWCHIDVSLYGSHFQKSQFIPAVHDCYYSCQSFLIASQ